MTEKKLPAAFFVSPESLSEWVRKAEPKEVLRYGLAAHLPKGSKTGAAVRALYEKGFVTMWHEREGEFRFRYMIRRTAKAWPVAVKAGAVVGMKAAAR